MILVQKFFPPASRLESFPVESNLPTRATSFIWMFVKQLGAPISLMVGLYSFGMLVFSFEPYIFGRLVDLASHSNADNLWANVFPILLGYVVIVQIIGRAVYNIGHLVESYTMPLLKMICRRSLAAYLGSHSYRFFNSDYAGRLAGKVMEMPQAITNVVGALCFPLMSALISGVVSVALFASMHWAFVPILIMYFVLNFFMCRYFLPRITAMADKSATAQQKARGLYIDSISNVLLVKLFGTRSYEDSLFIRSQVEAGSTEQREHRQFVLCWRAQNIINFYLQVSVALLSLHLYTKGQLGVGDLATALGLTLAICMHFWGVLHTLTGFFGQVAIINEALKTIIQPFEVKEPATPQPLALKDTSLVFHNVGFSYPGREVLKDFSLEIPAGQRVGIVGPSGAGKSTLVQLLLRLYDIQSGDILLGGQNITTVAQDELRRSIAVIPQSTELFHRSIFENITYGTATATREQAIEAARKAHIHETLESLQDNEGRQGYEAMVGERGVRLSGGQRQRVAIARAFLKDAPYLVLDEPTSALDSESEKLIQESLAPLLIKRTVLIIAHRLSTLAHLDRIIVMEKGAIVEDGSHTELLARKGLYARLWSLQSEGFIGEMIS